MAIDHAFPGQAVDVRPLGSRLRGTRTTALFKSADLEVMRVVLVAGKSLPPHVTVDGKSHVLEPGQLLYLAGHVVHGVTALEDASALVTVALKK